MFAFPIFLQKRYLLVRGKLNSIYFPVAPTQSSIEANALYTRENFVFVVVKFDRNRLHRLSSFVFFGLVSASFLSCDLVGPFDPEVIAQVVSINTNNERE